MINITEKAKKKIRELREADERSDLALRVTIMGRGAGNFLYNLQLIEAKDRPADDIEVDAGEFKTYLDAQSAPQLKDATLDFVEGPERSGFSFKNPNPLWTDPLAQSVQEVVDGKVNPNLAGHGGFVALVDVRDGTAYVRLGGGCQGCGMAKVTMSQGVEVMIREAVPAVTRVVDVTDHAAGTRPYEPAAGESPE